MRRLLAVCCGLLLSVSAWAAAPDWEAYGELLQHYVKPRSASSLTYNAVDYPAWRSDARWPLVLQALAELSLPTDATQAEQLAFYINAYNILAIKMVLDHWPVASIKDAGSWLRPVWKRPAGVVAGKTVSLDNIENDILRPLGEPRVHFAIVCASRSCPDLRLEPYLASRLSEQLDAQVRAFLANPGKGLLAEEKAIRVSKIFSWFAGDFAGAGGVEAFIQRYQSLPLGARVNANLPYDWSLNSSD